MEYNNQSVRRQDRLLDESQAIELLKNGEYGILSMVSEGDAGYGLPISYVVEEDKIYFHCAPEGEKLRALRKNNRASLCVVGKTKVISNQFTTAYESVIAKGNITVGLSDEEKMHALELILDKYSPNDKVVGLKYAQKSFARMEILRMDIVSVTGKCKSVPPSTSK